MSKIRLSAIQRRTSPRAFALAGQVHCHLNQCKYCAGYCLCRGTSINLSPRCDERVILLVRDDPINYLLLKRVQSLQVQFGALPCSAVKRVKQPIGDCGVGYLDSLGNINC